MENAADALKMAAAVLIFVLALSISINSFTEVRQTSQIILDSRDREYDYKYVENGETKRIVGVETIVPSIYKAYKENYKIIFNTNRLPDGLYQKRGEDGMPYPVYQIDLEKEVLGNDSQKEEFILAVLYGYNNTGVSDTNSRFQTNLGIYLNSQGIYGTIKGNKFEESLGVYYQEDERNDDGTITTSDAPEANKTKKRVITYSDI